MVGGRHGQLPASAGYYEDMVAGGWLTWAEAYEVSETLDLLLVRVRKGEITQHFAELVIEKLGADMEDRRNARNNR